MYAPSRDMVDIIILYRKSRVVNRAPYHVEHSGPSSPSYLLLVSLLDLPARQSWYVHMHWSAIVFRALIPANTTMNAYIQIYFMKESDTITVWREIKD